MGAKVTIVVYLPGKVPATGAEIVGKSKKALQMDKREWLGTTELDGSFTWSDFDAGKMGGFYDFKVIYVDKDGMAWNGSVSEWIAHSTTLAVTLTPGEEIEPLNISKGAIDLLEENEPGRGIVESVRQMQSAQNNGLSRAVMTLSAWTIEGLIRFKAQKEKIWRPEWGDKDLAGLVHTEEIAGILPSNLKEKVLDLADWRKTHAHLKGASTIPEDAQLACTIVKELIESWYGKKETIGNRMTRRNDNSIYDVPNIKRL